MFFFINVDWFSCRCLFLWYRNFAAATRLTIDWLSRWVFLRNQKRKKKKKKHSDVKWSIEGTFNFRHKSRWVPLRTIGRTNGTIRTKKSDYRYEMKREIHFDDDDDVFGENYVLRAFAHQSPISHFSQIKQLLSGQWCVFRFFLLLSLLRDVYPSISASDDFQFEY